MKNQSLSILFVIKLNKKNKKGMCPLNVRITYLKKRKEASSGIMVNPLLWDSKQQSSASRATSGEQINQQLEVQVAAIRKAYLKLQLGNDDFTVENIWDMFLGKVEKKNEYVISYFEKFLVKKSKLIGKDLKMSTWKKSEYVCADVAAFINSKYQKNDFPLIKLDQTFLDDFEYYLKTVKNQKQVTINKSIQRFRKPIKIAVAEGYLVSDPFVMHKPGRVRKEVIFLTEDELQLLEEYKFTQPRLQLVKDLFIFCCYTGLAYHEMANLKREHIIKGFDGNEWIKIRREKTNKQISIPLLPRAKVIMIKYNEMNDYVLPRFSNQKINSYLKEIAGIVGINKSITHHIARKTFASTVLLYNDVPMEIVSELLGHSSMKITQEYYGMIVQKRVGEEMERVSRKLEQRPGYE
ncbi:Site-specific recombinase XerD [Maribacter aquivivus]|uniref:Site-specific recombinase XerD n=1 Tax=Maribacter aquivivus TaxID=228958 RepID=A0A1M6L5K7_9FLAO|nr:site-specific integrase [Maribacter aquivivus]SHJ66493.1 Site-specific recombinase XerD [Maribacter aquivivus]